MMEHADIYNSINCFSEFYNNLGEFVRTHYFGVACKLRGQGKLLRVWFKFIPKLIEYGTLALVEYGDHILPARITHGYENRTGNWSELKLCFLGDEDSEDFVPDKNSYVIFKWGSGEPFSLNRFKHDILEMWYVRSLIGWDQDKSKKRILVEFETDPGKTGWKHPLNSYEKGFIAVISPQEMTNAIKKWQFLESKDSREREQLWKDLEKIESRLFRNLGIQHNPFAKEERQNNPEVISGQAFFYAWEVKHQEGLVDGILDFQAKPWGEGEYLLQFGCLPTLQISKEQVNYLEDKPSFTSSAKYPFINQQTINENNNKKIND